MVDREQWQEMLKECYEQGWKDALIHNNRELTEVTARIITKSQIEVQLAKDREINP